MSSSGGSGGLELEGGAGGTGGDELPIGGTSAGGAVGAGGTSGAGGGGLGPLDEPCPTDAIGVDCSGQCAARAPICDSACPSVVTIPPLKDGLIVGRLPSHPKASCTCDDSKSPFIGAQPAVYALTFQNGSIPKESFHLSVPPPWKITSGFTTGCASSVAQVKCINNLTWFTVWTSDPDAPAVNLVAEAGDRCP